MYCAHREWIQTEIDIARELGKPIIGIELWGHERTPLEVQNAARKMVGWSSDSIVEAVRAVCPAVLPRLVQISYTVSVSVNQALVDSAVGQISLDWYRYAWNCYFSWTTLDTGTICTHIRRVSGLEHAYVVVCGIREEDGHANLPWSIWNWLRDKA